MKHIVLKMTHHLLVPDEFKSSFETMEDVVFKNQKEIDEYTKKNIMPESMFQYKGHKLEPHMIWLKIENEEENIKISNPDVVEDIKMEEIEMEMEMEMEIMKPKFKKFNYDENSDDDPEIYSDEERKRINAEEGLDENDITQWILYIDDEEYEEFEEEYDDE